MSKSEAFKDLLNDQHQWPCDYTFKFIVPQDKQSEVEALFPSQQIDVKESAKGAYISLTVVIKMDSADLVVAIYEKAATIQGLIAL